MATASPCPGVDDLERFLAGKLPADNCAQLSAHLSACAHCQEIAHTAKPTDTLLEALRGQKASAPLPECETVERLMGELKSLGMGSHDPAETVAATSPPDESTPPADRMPPAERTQELYEFLSPPEQAGEIGRLGGYRVLSVLGTGGMGVVFLAEDPGLERRVGLKAMLPSRGVTADSKTRFLREARAAAAIKHDHIVTIHQVGEDRGVPFLAMELLDGEALEDRIKRVGKLPLAEVTRIGREIAEGLAAAHQRGLIHRDIKPGNIWLESRGEAQAARGEHKDPLMSSLAPRVKILDFGLARSAHEDVHLTQSGAIVGTPAYMPPEQARGDAVDARCDLYSLGCVLYRLCTGELPFKADSTMGLLLALATEQPKSVRELNPDVPPALADLIMRLLAKDPAQRPATAGEVAEALSAVDAAEPTIVKPACIPVPPRRWRRLAVAATGGALALAALLTVIVIRLGGPEEGTITIETVDPNVELVFNNGGRDFTVRDTKTGEEIKLPLGTYQVELKGNRNGLKLETPQFTLKSGDRVLVKVTRQAGQPPVVARADIPAPMQIAEPPPLAEWLRGRKVLTVSQNGQAHFKTIQAALNVLKPHEAIEVLDRGPYQERLELSGVPQDTGLISKVQTVVELRELKRGGWKEEGADFYKGHRFEDTDGFRLSGFHFVFPKVDELTKLPGGFLGQGLRVNRPGGLILEDCKIHGPAETYSWNAVFFGVLDGGSTKPLCVRDCVIEGRLGIVSASSTDVSALVRHNYLKDTAKNLPPLMLGGPGSFGTVAIRHNVLQGSSNQEDLNMSLLARVKTLDVSNNTMSGRNAVIVSLKVPRGAARFQNNLSTKPGFLGFTGGAEKQAGDALGAWQVGHNAYARLFAAGEIAPLMFPQGPGDVVGRAELLSYDPGHPDYLHIPADNPLAKGGAGGAWPSYIGALPPGPATKGGDWFTRLRQRWGDLAPVGESPMAPVQIVEPPPLAEWLKGRKILTVAQDGSGQFATIQEALDALKPHQAVKVLDRGPYKEVLRVISGLPEDTGLFSEQQSVLELAEWREGEFAGPSWGAGHVLKSLGGFRLSGLRLLAPPRKDPGESLTWRRAADLVVEDCYFGCTKPTTYDRHIGFNFTENDPNPKPTFVRNCLFDTVSLGVGLTSGPAPVLVVERNYFRKAIFAATRPHFHTILVRHNVFDFPTSAIWIQDLEEVQGLEISNNTAVGTTAHPIVSIVHTAPKQGIAIRNNIANSPLILDSEASKVRADAIKNWQVDHNCYSRQGTLPRSPTDVIADPQFLSLDPSHADYLHISADSPAAKTGVGGAWPSYIGAFPPGPAPREGDWFTRLQNRWTKAPWP